MEFGEHLKEWRSHRRLSQLELASEAGISARHLSFLETGRSRPSEGMILRLSAVLDRSARTCSPAPSTVSVNVPFFVRARGLP